MTITHERVPEFAVVFDDPERDPYPQYAELRAAAPVFKMANAPGAWGITRHADVSALLRDNRLGHEMPRPVIEFTFGDGAGADFQTHSLLNRDPPDHTRLRTLMGKAFSASLVRKMREHIGDLVDDLLAPLLDRQDFDVVADLAFPLPSQVICELLGITNADRDEVRSRAVDVLSLDIDAVNESTRWFRDYMGAVLAERRPDPDGDLFERMLAAEDGEDALTHEEIVDNAILLFVAGFETTKSLIANGVAALLAFPSELARLLADPTLSTTGVEEFLRFDSPLPFVQRYTREPLEVGSHVIKPGRVVLMMLACANHDEAVFADPESLDIARSPNPHVAFAGGIHHCLGAMLARVEGDVVFNRVATRVRCLEGAGPPRRVLGNIRSFATLPVRATAR